MTKSIAHHFCHKSFSTYDHLPTLAIKVELVLKSSTLASLASCEKMRRLWCKTVEFIQEWGIMYGDDKIQNKAKKKED